MYFFPYLYFSTIFYFPIMDFPFGLPQLMRNVLDSFCLICPEIVSPALKGNTFPSLCCSDSDNSAGLCSPCLDGRSTRLPWTQWSHTQTTHTHADDPKGVITADYGHKFRQQACLKDETPPLTTPWHVLS